MTDLLLSADAWASLVALTAMEVVLGIDNVVFITILCGRLPQERQLTARRLGLSVALVVRLLLLFTISAVMQLTAPLFTLVVAWSGKDLILLVGGLFLLWKATHEIYVNVECPAEGEPRAAPSGKTAVGDAAARKLMVAILVQVTLLDVVFSLDSVITAVGMASHLPVMVVAMIAAVAVMVLFAGPVGDFVQRHPSVRILALAFLVLIGVMLVLEATGQHVPKGYIYSAMAFSLLVELLNLRRRRHEKAVSP